MDYFQPILHYSLHFIFPGLIAFIFFRKNWKRIYLIFLATMLVDLDHLIANPIFDPNRCGINYHPLHSYIAIGVYFLLLVPKQTRVIALGLLFHMGTDWIDCLWMS